MSDCNCSICTRKGFLHLIVAKDQLELLTAPEAVATYTFNTGVAKHHFCSTCGVHSFYVPRSHPNGFSVNARCLDDVDLSWFEREHFDGQNWEKQIHTFEA